MTRIASGCGRLKAPVRAADALSVHDRTDTPSLARMGHRLLGRPSAHPRDIGTRLDRALHIASRTADGRAPHQARPVQVVAEAHRDPESYRRRRGHQGLRSNGAWVPELSDGEWACVLWAMAPAALQGFARETATGLMGPPIVGRFGGSVNLDVGLAATLAAWLRSHREVLLAPPLLSEGDGPYRLAALRRAWPLPAADVQALDGERASVDLA